MQPPLGREQARPARRAVGQQVAGQPLAGHLAH